MSRDRFTRISKFLSYVLRHRPQAVGLALDAQGWASIDELIEKARPQMALNRELIEQVVSTNDKQRFALSEDGTRIRANQGHSLDVDIGLEPRVPPALLYHGTATRFMDSINRDGLVSGRRQHVHLSLDAETAHAVGRRHGKPVILQIDAKAMHEQGMLFYVSANGVWLTEHVPTRFISQSAAV